MQRFALAVIAGAVVALAPGAVAQEGRGDGAGEGGPPRELLEALGAEAQRAPSPGTVELSTAARRAIGAEYLSEAEARARRVFHGVWGEGDLATPALAAEAALIAGVWDHESFGDGSVPVEVRAAAMVARGDLRRAVGTLSGAERTLRGQRLLAEAYEGLGRMEEAAGAAEPVIAALREGADVLDAAALVDVVRAARVSARARGLPAQDYQRLLGLLARARQLDPLYWPAPLEEARLLLAKDNGSEAREAVTDALSLCPRSSGALAVLAEMSVRSFNLDGAEEVAAALDKASASVSEGVASPLGALWRARALLRENDPDLAEEALGPALERFPRQRDLFATACAVEAVRYDRGATEAALTAFDGLSPGSPLALYVAGKAMSENRQYGRAAALLERAVERAPAWPPPQVALGLLYVQSANDGAARRWLERAVELDPFQKRAKNSLEMLEGLADFGTLESEHFVVRYKPGVDRVMAGEMLPVLERIHERVAGEFEHEPSRKTRVELMPDHEWFAVRITGMPALHTIAAATGPLIAMEAPKIGPDHTGVYDWPRVVQHEYAHTITLSRTNNRLPHWFTEAAAVNVEDAPRAWSTWLLLAQALKNDALFDLREINLAFVRPEKPSDRGQAYAQGAWMYQYLKETHGERAPLELMDLYAEGVREGEAFRRVLGIGRDEFFENFRAWAADDLRAHGLLVEPGVGEMLEMAEIDGLDGASALSLLEAHPEHPDLLRFMWERALEESGGRVTAEAARWLERYAAARPVDPEPHRLLARHYLDAGPDAGVGVAAAEKAVEHLAFLDAREQHSAVYAVERSKRLSELGRLGDAREAAERAVRIAPFDADHRELAAAAALRQGDWGGAERHVAALVEIEPGRDIHRLRLKKVRERIGAASGG